jgi:hypothetical protein
VGYEEKFVSWVKPHFVKYPGATGFKVAKVTEKTVTAVVDGTIVFHVKIADYVNDMLQYRLDLKDYNDLQ